MLPSSNALKQLIFSSSVTLDFKTVDDTSLGVEGHGLGSQEQELVLQNGREDSNKQSESSMHPS